MALIGPFDGSSSNDRFRCLCLVFHPRCFQAELMLSSMREVPPLPSGVHPIDEAVWLLVASQLNFLPSGFGHPGEYIRSEDFTLQRVLAAVLCCLCSRHTWQAELTLALLSTLSSARSREGDLHSSRCLLVVSDSLTLNKAWSFSRSWGGRWSLLPSQLSPASAVVRLTVCSMRKRSHCWAEAFVWMRHTIGLCGLLKLIIRSLA